MSNPTLEEQLAAAQKKIEWYKGKIEELVKLDIAKQLCPPVKYCNETNNCAECWARFWRE